MRSPDIAGRRVPRGPFPRPNLTMRELIGLVPTFAVSNAFLSWINPMARSNAVLFGLWNGLLAMDLGSLFVAAWAGSVIRWIRTGDADPPCPRRRWTALGIAEATVIGGTMIWCLILLYVRISNPQTFVHSHDWTAPMAILLLGSAAAILVLRMWRAEPGKSLTDRGTEPTIEGGAEIERGETF